jgi:hypothetical protein
MAPAHQRLAKPNLSTPCLGRYSGPAFLKLTSQQPLSLSSHQEVSIASLPLSFGSHASFTSSSLAHLLLRSSLIVRPLIFPFFPFLFIHECELSPFFYRQFITSHSFHTNYPPVIYLEITQPPLLINDPAAL